MLSSRTTSEVSSLTTGLSDRGLPLCNTWWNAQDIIQQFSMDDVVLGMSSQITEADDAVVTDDLRSEFTDHWSVPGLLRGCP